LAVISYGDYVLEVHPSYDPRHQWIVPVSVSGPMDFLLFAVWTLPLGNHGGRYVRPLFEAFESYKPLIESSEAIWAGDFNSSYLFDRPSRTYKFSDFVALLAQVGLHSVYHRQRACGHGEELEKTFYLHHNEAKGHHIDYIFARERFHPHGVSVSVGPHAEWSKRSDHTPLMCEFHLRAQMVE
jgi:endonuclease/exonuclease/phosphatase (EEP) superfamily protein YafD